MTDIYVKAGDSVQAAINGAVSGDTIILADGIYREAVTVSKAVTLRAENPGKAIIDGVTPPITRPDVGAALAVDEPEPEPEPEPDEPPAWAQPLVDLGAQLQAAEDILTQLAGMKATLAGLIDALDDQLVEAAATYDELAAALNGEGAAL